MRKVKFDCECPLRVESEHSLERSVPRQVGPHFDALDLTLFKLTVPALGRRRRRIIAAAARPILKSESISVARTMACGST